MSKYALITGASRGLGEFLARKFWDSDYNLCLVSRDIVALEKVISSLPEKSRLQATCLACDMGDELSVAALPDRVKNHLPNLDVLVNNAAMHGPIGPLWDNDTSVWKQTIQVNLLAPVFLCHAFIPWMIERKNASIINLSGGGATGPRANFTAYGTAKAGLVRFSETLAEEVKSYGIRVNCIAPGAMRTSLLAEVLENGADTAGDREFEIATKVFESGGASMEQVANLALFLASDASSGITGKLISAVWDDWEHWPKHIEKLASSDVYTLRRIVGRDRGFTWGDK